MATTIIVIGDDGVTVTDRAEETRSSPRTSQPKRRKKSRYQAAYARNFKDLKRNIETRVFRWSKLEARRRV